jgi:hypothetical protein
MKETINDRLISDGAEVREESIEDSGRFKTILTANFPDGSSARIPQNLWIDYSTFDRV